MLSFHESSLAAAPPKRVSVSLTRSFPPVLLPGPPLQIQAQTFSHAGFKKPCICRMTSFNPNLTAHDTPRITLLTSVSWGHLLHLTSLFGLRHNTFFKPQRCQLTPKYHTLHGVMESNAALHIQLLRVWALLRYAAQPRPQKQKK